MIILIDNYDSFSYNLYQMLGVLEPDIRVYRNDALTVEQILEQRPAQILLSPGPGYPSRAGVCEALVKRLAEEKRSIPLLGVCLGHQGICEALGGTIVRAGQLMHGKQSQVRLNTETCLFRGLEKQILVGRYHSLAVEEKSLPDCLKVTARAEDGEIMAVEHSELPIYGIQFHPESILTPDGQKILENFRKIGQNEK